MGVVELNFTHVYMIYVLCLYTQMLWKNTKETGNGCFKEEQSNSETQGKGDIVSTISPFTNFFF